MQTPPEHDYPDHWEADVVLRDGGTARIRPITTEDAERLVSFYEQVSDESKYYRFFAPYPHLSAKDVHRFTHHDYVDRVGLAVTVGGEFIATVRYDRIDALGRPAAAPADEAEVAFLVQDAHQGRGVASTLLEHIAAVARERGIRRFAAEVLPANNKMIKVFRDAGYTQKRSFEDGSVHLTLDLEPTEKSLAVQRAREQRAEARSVQRLLAPGSVAVVGTGRAPAGVGRSLLRNLLAAGYTGRVYGVNRAFPADRREVEGVPAFRSVGEIVAVTGEPVDLAIVTVPAERVPEVVTDCGENGVRGLVVLSAGYAESGAEGRRRQRELVRLARSYGMRIIGPNAFGIISTAESVRLNASLAPRVPAPGRIGLFTQSGAIGIALLSGLDRRGAGLSTFISSGNRADVSGNDFLQYWYDDPDTDVVLLYLESIGNPRKFTRLARRTAAVKPVVVVKGARHSGSEPPGHAVPVTRIPDAAVGALLRQAGVIRVDTVTELVDVGLLLAGQPLPAGPRVAILGNSESLGLLTYDACLAEGLRPLPPLDLTTEATPADFRAALCRALADDGCDAVVVTAIPWVGESGDTEPGYSEVLAETLREAAASAPAKPVAVVHVELDGLTDVLAAARGTGGEGIALRPRSRSRPEPDAAPRTAASAPGAPDALGEPGSGPGAPGDSGITSADGPDAPGTPSTPGTRTPGPDAPGTPGASSAPAPAPVPVPVPVPAPGEDPARARRRIPAYPAAERAVRALSQAVAYARWRRDAAEPGKVPAYDDIDESGAAARIERLLGAGGGGTLPADEAHGLLARYGIQVRPTLPAPGPDEAAEAAARLGYPVALKTTAPHLRHRADLGGVRLDLANEEQLRLAYREITDLLGIPVELRLVVQSMAPRGVDTVVRAVIDPAVGAVLSFGLAGAASELLGDTSHRLVPATDRDAAELIRTIRTAPLLFGWRGSAPVDTPALEELLLRVSRLVDDHPEVVGISLEPVVVAQRGLSVLGASVRLAPPATFTDLGPRRLPSY
ncbi:bifunctional acetate--CoA ligase family protein/GNAT family N-acetyltransferase [Streptomyces katsurahamanus]|uniref:GNAT family N-acetyltransferase n=1 Tax=Streptomyces katsurahamanus TaxID=2577098 RepID=A0ABW9NMA9_9ACTN|nr:GNAT family N-acetyltransferase [Streptomyces katsurahamanus]MQS34441.1 GNAT family N-acetyltransferase [Streptomyces katsurahamanus]